MCGIPHRFSQHIAISPLAKNDIRSSKQHLQGLKCIKYRAKM